MNSSYRSYLPFDICKRGERVNGPFRDVIQRSWKQFRLKLQNSLKLPHILARFYSNANEQS